MVPYHHAHHCHCHTHGYVVLNRYAQLLFRTQPRTKRQPQKVFLVLGVLQCMCRATYISLWPFLNPNLDSPMSGGPEDKDNW
jgi:DNA-directed RNA polymerase subunit N (RpoN/RPB10)